MTGDSGVAREGRVVGVPKFHSRGKWTMPLTNINSDWMSNVCAAGGRLRGGRIFFLDEVRELSRQTTEN